MAQKYYLIPFETDTAKMHGMDFCPKYFTEYGLAWGLQPKNWRTENGREFLQRYYVVCIENVTNQAAIEKYSDVIPIVATMALSNLAALGIDTSKIAGTGQTKIAGIQRAVTKWLIGSEALFTEVTI